MSQHTLGDHITQNENTSDSLDNIDSALAQEGIYSEIPEIISRLNRVLPILLKEGFLFQDAYPIPYGTRITLRFNDSSVNANLYYSKKKGFSLVVDRTVSQEVAIALKNFILFGDSATCISSDPDEKLLKVWIGSDESGKGDYLGPLVVASFLTTPETLKDLIALQVKDSKQVQDQRCREIARFLYGKYPNLISVVELVPETYNRLYEQFRSEGKKLNSLLAWAHSQSIKNLYQQDVEAIVIDKFAAHDQLFQYLHIKTKIIFRERAEDNIGVAAASILARARFLYRIEKLSEQYQIKFALGGGCEADAVAVECVKRYGKDVLDKIAKVHFRNSQRVLKS
jgi:ribonuclease HIII